MCWRHIKINSGWIFWMKRNWKETLYYGRWWKREFSLFGWYWSVRFAHRGIEMREMWWLWDMKEVEAERELRKDVEVKRERKKRGNRQIGKLGKQYEGKSDWLTRLRKEGQCNYTLPKWFVTCAVSFTSWPGSNIEICLINCFSRVIKVPDEITVHCIPNWKNLLGRNIQSKAGTTSLTDISKHYFEVKSQKAKSYMWEKRNRMLEL